MKGVAEKQALEIIFSRELQALLRYAYSDEALSYKK